VDGARHVMVLSTAGQQLPPRPAPEDAPAAGKGKGAPRDAKKGPAP
jgi:hypothetical protein